MQRMMTGVLLGSMAWSTPSAAQDRTVAADLGNVVRDARFIVGSPVHATPRDAQTALRLAAAGGLALLLDETIHDWLDSDPFLARALSPFGETSPIAIMGRTLFFLLPLSATLYGAGHALGSGDLRDAGLGCATANLTTTLTRSVTSLLLGRQRPGVQRGPFEFEVFAFGDWNQRSFPGGHASNIMSCASYFNRRFDLGIAGSAIYALAGGVGLARTVDEAHWTSDTFVGMAYGFAVGANVADRAAERNAQRRSERSVQPGLTIRWTIRF